MSTPESPDSGNLVMWGIGAAWTLLTILATKIWTASGAYTSINSSITNLQKEVEAMKREGEESNAQTNERVKALEKLANAQAAFCNTQREAILNEFRNRLSDMLEATLTKWKMDNNKELSSIDKTMALQSQRLEDLSAKISDIKNEIKKTGVDIAEIHGRLDRREQGVTEPTDIRRATDV